MAERFNLDLAEAALLPWELEFESGGKTFRIRAPRLAEVLALESLAQSKGSETQAIRIILGMFEGDKPDLTLNGFMVLARRIMLVMKEHAAKNSQAIAAAAAGAIAKTGG
jgi:hypothetical protein